MANPLSSATASSSSGIASSDRSSSSSRSASEYFRSAASEPVVTCSSGGVGADRDQRFADPLAQLAWRARRWPAAAPSASAAVSRTEVSTLPSAARDQIGGEHVPLPHRIDLPGDDRLHALALRHLAGQRRRERHAGGALHPLQRVGDGLRIQQPHRRRLGQIHPERLGERGARASSRRVRFSKSASRSSSRSSSTPEATSVPTGPMPSSRIAV